MRIRPDNGREREGDWFVRKISDESVAVGERKFNFDSVLDSKSNQVPIIFPVLLVVLSELTEIFHHITNFLCFT